jgi:hypothetical protein
MTPIEPLHRTKRAIYVVLLCVAIISSSFALYNQYASDSTTKSLGDQVTQACQQNRVLALAQGLNCDQAKDASQGNVVIKGEKGDKGDTGATGASGQDGESIVGPSGASGSNGMKGETGDTGATGATGPVGAKGDTGVQGDPGVAGPPGEKGNTGDKGDRGGDGEPAPHVSSTQFVPNPCRFRTNYTDGTFQDAPTSEELCM